MSAGKICLQSLHCIVLDLSICALHSFGTLKVCPAEFWSNVSTIFSLSKIRFTIFLKVIFLTNVISEINTTNMNIFYKKKYFMGR